MEFTCGDQLYFCNYKMIKIDYSELNDVLGMKELERPPEPVEVEKPDEFRILEIAAPPRPPKKDLSKRRAETAA